ncbi:MAG: recombinase family protein [Solirubrobacteraceae bacterium]
MGENKQIEREDAEEARGGSSLGTGDPDERLAAPRRGARNAAAHMRSANGATRLPVIGYASCSCSGSSATLELKQQAEVITRECKRRGLALLEVVGERSPTTGKGLHRPGLAYALHRINSREATGLVVAELSRITDSVGELGTIMEWILGLNARLVASADAFDTECEGGRLAAGLLIEVSAWERNRISERTRNGLQAARMSGRSTGRPAVVDDPDLGKRIAHMRAQGMTLQAIADQLNEDGVPTVRGGAKWRHSSVQAAAGYRRRQRAPRGAVQIQPVSAGEQRTG